jgi:hypothetical protein
MHTVSVCRSIPSPAVRERGDRPRSGWWERAVHIGAALGDESVGFRTGTGCGSAPVKLDAVERCVGDGAGDFLSWQKVTKNRVPAGRPDAGEPDRSASGASQRANARTRTSGPGCSFNVNLAQRGQCPSPAQRERGGPSAEPMVGRGPAMPGARFMFRGAARGMAVSEKVAPWMAGNRGPRVARRLPRSLDSVFRTSSSDPG